MDVMYTPIGTVSQDTIAQLRSIVTELSWWKKWETHVSDITNHQAVPCTELIKTVDEIVDLWPIKSWDQLSFFRLVPGGNLYRHADTGFGFHIPIESNEHAESMTYPDGVKTVQNLKVGKVYHIDRSIEHESFNRGETDRTHLIVLLKERGNE